jgi:hypothetical protein
MAHLLRYHIASSRSIAAVISQDALRNLLPSIVVEVSTVDRDQHLKEPTMRPLAFALPVVLLAAALVRGDEPKAPPIKPDLDRCALKIGDRVVQARLVPVEEREHWAGNLRIVLTKKEVRAYAADAAADAAPKWTAAIPADVELHWLGASDKVIHFAAFKDDLEETPARIRRLDRATGKWLDDLVFDVKLEPKERIRVVDLQFDQDRVAAFTTLGMPGDNDRTDRRIAYHVHLFDAKSTKPAWSKRFDAAGRLPYTAGYLLAARRPDAARHAVQPLSWMDGDLVVCAGPLDDILCLFADDGTKKWQMTRLWEYRRGFIGPSVWSHYISRDGEDRVDEKKTPPKKEEPDKLQSIVAGPIVVKAAAGESSLFVAVAKGPMRWGAYLSECTVYELGHDGQPITMTSTPRLVIGGRHEVVDGGLVWACQGGGFLRVAASKNFLARFHGMGPGGSDCLTAIDWHRQFPKSEPKAWLGSDPAGDPIAMGAGKAFRVPTGGYVAAPAEKVFRFPITMIALDSGMSRNLELSIPFDGKIVEPKTNCSIRTFPDGTKSIHAMGPYVMAVTLLQVDRDRLRITLGMDEWHRTFEVPIRDLEDAKSK